MKTKHTQGPWCRNIKPASKYPVVFAGRNTHVATVSRAELSEEEIEANICLISASPELLEALKLADAALSGANMNMAVVKKKIKSAIAKAEAQS